VYLPASKEKALRAPAPLSPDTYKGRGETVLVVDDMPDQLEIASRILEKLGYRAVTAASGEQAVAYLKDNPVDLVILDMIMEPGIDGLETYRRILRVRPGQKTIIASGFSESERVKTAEALGAGAYIRKPYLLEEIGAAIRIQLDRRPAGRRGNPPS
jgi:two-component system cell cycle sensor histidine kinase/response regulator CckA